MIRELAEKMSNASCFYLFDERKTEEAIAYRKRFKYLIEKYEMENSLADDPDIYEFEFSAWQDDHLQAFEKELDFFMNKYQALINSEQQITESIDDNENDEGAESIDPDEEI